MKMKEVIMLTGIPERTIRFYEERGMLQVPTERRNGRTYHDFTENNIRELKQIVILRKARFSLDEILEMQKHPEKIESIVEANFTRLDNEMAELEKLTQDESLKDAADWAELSQKAEHALRAIPGYVSPLRFGQGDAESPEEKQEAIAAYRKNTITRDHILLYVFLGLALFFLAMAVVFGVLLYQASREAPTAPVAAMTDAVPAPSGTTEGYTYYQLDRCIARANENGTEEEIIYESATENSVIQFLVETDKLYILDDSRLFSVNADGTGLYEYAAEVLPEYYNGGSGGWLWDIFLFYQDSLFVIQQDSPHEMAVVRVPADGGTQKELDIDLASLSNLCGWIWEETLYVYGVDTDLEYLSEDETQFTSSTSSVIITYNLTRDELIASTSGDFITDCANGLYFGAEEGYFYNGNETIPGTYEIIRVTPSNPAGESYRQYEDVIWTVYGDWVILGTEVEGTIINFRLENMETGSSVDLGERIPLTLNFTPRGLRMAPGEYIPYP